MTIYKFKKDPFSSHKRIADCIFEEKCRKILDVGCNKGQILKALDGWRGVIWGIDKDEAVLKEVAGRYTKVLKIDVDREPLNFHDMFDAVVFGDILEHTENPRNVILKFLPRLKPGGIMVISVPNFAHWFMRLNLLLGRFNYVERGILDETHLKFFTLKSAREMISKSGLLIERVKATPIPLPLMVKSTDLGKPFFFLHVVNYAITKIRKSFFGYQFVFKCKKKHS